MVRIGQAPLNSGIVRVDWSQGLGFGGFVSSIQRSVFGVRLRQVFISHRLRISSRCCRRRRCDLGWVDYLFEMAQSAWQKLKNQWAAETRDEEKLAAHLVMLVMVFVLHFWCFVWVLRFCCFDMTSIVQKFLSLGSCVLFFWGVMYGVV